VPRRPSGETAVAARAKAFADPTRIGELQPPSTITEDGNPRGMPMNLDPFICPRGPLHGHSRIAAPREATSARARHLS
jgi:hypothetical protein